MAFKLGPRSRATLLVGGLISLGIFLWYYYSHEKRPSSVHEISNDSKDSKVGLNKLPKGIYIDLDSEFARDYASERTTIESDFEILKRMLGHVVLLIKDFSELPLADNQDFTRLLTGENMQRFAWCPPNHSSINSDGELMDRWGTPLFFHRESALRTGLRSAGEDRKMWTDDDIVFSPSSQDP